jgi:hypothetical protein
LNHRYAVRIEHVLGLAADALRVHRRMLDEPKLVDRGFVADSW